jgi:lysozyme
MKTSQTGLNLIKSFEGCILQAYDDANDRIVRPGQQVVGTLTIGYGHTSSAGLPRVFIGQKITKEQAEQILANDLQSVEKDVERLVKVKLNQNQFDALVSFHYNTGALGKSSALRYLNNGDYDRCASALLLYNRGNGQVLQGLVRRREAEKALFNKPIDPGVGTVIAGGTGLLAMLTGHPIAIVAGCAVVALTIGYLIYKHRKTNNVNIPQNPVDKDPGSLKGGME